MAKAKGSPKTGGRRKGVKNKKTQSWEDFGARVIEGNLDKVENYINGLEPEQQFEAMIKLFEYFKPKLSRSDVNNSGEQTLNIKFQKNVSKDS